MGSARTRRGICDYSSRFSLITAAIARPTAAKDIPLAVTIARRKRERGRIKLTDSIDSQFH